MSKTLYENVFVHESSYVDKKVSIGEGSKIWHFSHILSHTQLGRNCTVGQNVVIGPNVKIGNNVKVQNNVSIFDGVTLEDDVFCGPSAVFTNVINPRAKVERKKEFKKTHVCRGVTIGANSTIICGNKLEKYCFIAAGAVVTKNVGAYSLMIGSPAKHAGWMSEAGHQLIFDKDGLAICEITKEHYILKNNQVFKN